MAVRLRRIGTTVAVRAAAVLTVAPTIVAGPTGQGSAVRAAVALVDHSTPSAPPHCDASQPRGQVAHYQGGSVSALYDKVFHPWAGVPYLDTHVPQALATWRNWDGAGHTLVLLGMYRKDHHSFLVGVDPKSGHAIGTVEIKESHLGGMGFVGPWLFAQDNADAHQHPTVRRYRIDALRTAMREAAADDDHPFLHADGPARPIDAIDFFAVEGNSVYAGHHGNPRTAKMFRYTLTHDGRLQRVEGPWRIPEQAQGMVVTPKAFVFSSSRGVGRGQLSFVRRSAPSAISEPFACVWLPAMPEDMTVVDGTLLIDFESGTKRYAHSHPANRIRHFHEGILAALLSLTHAGDPPPAYVAAAVPQPKPRAAPQASTEPIGPLAPPLSRPPAQQSAPAPAPAPAQSPPQAPAPQAPEEPARPAAQAPPPGASTPSAPAGSAHPAPPAAPAPTPAPGDVASPPVRQGQAPAAAAQRPAHSSPAPPPVAPQPVARSAPPGPGSNPVPPDRQPAASGPAPRQPSGSAPAAQQPNPGQASGSPAAGDSPSAQTPADQPAAPPPPAPEERGRQTDPQQRDGPATQQPAAAQAPPAGAAPAAPPPSAPQPRTAPAPPNDAPSPVLSPNLPCRIACVPTAARDFGPTGIDRLPDAQPVPDLRTRRARTVA